MHSKLSTVKFNGTYRITKEVCIGLWTLLFGLSPVKKKRLNLGCCICKGITQSTEIGAAEEKKKEKTKLLKMVMW